jgi:hypothetical protein
MSIIFFALVCYKQNLKVIKEFKHVWQKNEKGENIFSYYNHLIVF